MALKRKTRSKSGINRSTLRKSTRPDKAFWFTVILPGLLLFASCGEEGSSTHDDRSGKRFYPKHATGFYWIVRDKERTLVIRDPRDTTRVYGELTFPDSGVANDHLALLSTTHVSYFDTLRAQSLIAGVAYADRLDAGATAKALENGEIDDISGDPEVDPEKLKVSGAELLLGYPGMKGNTPAIEDLGVRIIPVTEFLELHPLGRAEWILAFGAISGKLDRARSIFSGIEEDYVDLKNKKCDSTSVPTVFFGSSYRGVWNASPGNSLVARLISDAGGEYIYSNRTAEGNLTLDTEAVLRDMDRTDWWGLTVHIPGEKDVRISSVAENHTYSQVFPPVKNEQVFAVNSAENDYFTGGALRPQVMLADLIYLLHPGCLPGHKPHYFKPVSFEED